MTDSGSKLKMSFQSVLKQVTSVGKKFNNVPRLVAVSKLKDWTMIKTVYDQGHLHFGENYVQEICEKSEKLPNDIQWHFIGHLQSNKCGQLIKGVPNLSVVETVDSEKLANKLNNACKENRPNKTLNIYIQVNTSKEESKSGAQNEKGCISLCKHIIEKCPYLTVGGLMTIGKYGDPKPEPYFKMLYEIRNNILKERFMKEKNITNLELSMGMSGDFEKAIEP
eukprot:UN26274